MVDDDPLAKELREVRASGLLGRSDILTRLFDYLAGCSINRRSPKEVEIAHEVFGRPSSFDASQDAVVRVYIHKLRRRLKEIYTGPRSSSPTHLIIPLGEYRLIAAPSIVLDERADAIARELRFLRLQWKLLTAFAVMLALLSSVATYVAQQALASPSVREIQALRHKSIWSPLLDNKFPNLIVLGDYYIFGESDSGVVTDRLVREYDINSHNDLELYLMNHPQKIDHYIDLGLQYLPTGSAYALSDVSRVAEFWRTKKPIRMILSSQFTADMLKSNNIVYIGYFSGLRALRDTVFAGSRFTIGENYDDLIDNVTKTNYISQGGGPESDGSIYRDFGYLSTFRGPSGNSVIIIAGDRDVGLMQTAETATHEAPLKEAVSRAGRRDMFEALYEVKGMDRLNIDGRLVVAAPLDGNKIWDRSSPKHRFPAG